MKCEVGLVGLAVMGRNLALNIAEKGFKVAVFNRTASVAKEFAAREAKGLPVEAAAALPDFVNLLEKPRRILLMVKAGDAVDEMIAQLAPLLEPGDLVADLGNSHFRDTERRADELSGKGIHFLGVGVSGGEEGARKGPSIMAGGPEPGWELVRPVFEKIAAQASHGPCAALLGPRGAGHLVKTLHNGIEYGDMQLIAEVYDILRRVAFMKPEEIGRAFREFNRSELNSYLTEITAEILLEKDRATGRPLIDVILDVAGQKGTGAWCAELALELGAPAPSISAAVEMRNLSAQKQMRAAAEKAIITVKPKKPPRTPSDYLKKAAAGALYAARLSLYAQAIEIARAAKSIGYEFSIPALARVWKNGCIIRGAHLGVVERAFSEDPEPVNLLTAREVVEAIDERYDRWGNLIRIAIAYGIPCPGFYSALAYFEAVRTSRLPANLIAAQRDYFGAHTFQRVDKEGAFHHRWKKKE